MASAASSVAERKAQLDKMATPEFTKEMAALIRSRSPVIYLVTSEEKRVLEYFRHYTIAGGYRTFVWDCYNGLLKLTSMEPAGLISGDAGDPNEVLDWIVKEAAQDEAAGVSKRKSRVADERDSESDEKRKDDGVTKGNIYILLDFHRFLGEHCTPDVERRLRTLARMDSNSVVIIVGPSYRGTSALDKEMRIIDFPYPNKEEIKSALYKIVDSVADKVTGLKKDTEKREEEIINSVSGLSFTELCAAFAKSICMHRSMHIPTILKEKQEVIRKTGILEYFQPEVSINDVGGLDNLVNFLRLRKNCFKEEAKNYGLPSPKGVLLIGVPGAGKSMAAKAAASLFEMPLLRLDFGSLFNAHVGESEKQARTATKIAEALAPCILWIDEIEKGLSGFRSSGSTDSGVTSRVISTLLTWMQEKTAPVFLMCTANQHESIPPEFMRAGRFDEIFFVDVPSRGERSSIVEKLILRKKRNPKKFDLDVIAAKSDGYTGAELEKAIDNALLVGFQEGLRDITTEDIVDSLSKFKPLSVMRPEVIEAMRTWADGRCLKANTPEIVPGSVLGTTKRLDLD
jgi:ATP-dependent 26S proteasome regulatory subunit